MSGVRRRDVLKGAALAFIGGTAARGGIIEGQLPFAPSVGAPPPFGPGWQFFTSSEAATLEALVYQIIPPDPQTCGGKDAGCAVFIDRQLAGGYGAQEGDYTLGPFHTGTESQGPQTPLTPRDVYRRGLAALDQHAGTVQRGRTFGQLPPAEQEQILHDIEDGKLQLPGIDAKGFLKLLIDNTTEGFFADPIYGGNRDMCGWKMVGFPGARYDYRDWVDRHNERFPLPPIGIRDHPDWKE